jgi:hypothetical protein
VLFDTTDLIEEDEHLAIGVGFVAEETVDEGGSGVAITTVGNTIVGAVGDDQEDVVEFVRHTTGLEDVAGAVELGSDDVVHHTVRDKLVTVTKQAKTHSYPPASPTLPPTTVGPMMRTPLL